MSAKICGDVNRRIIDDFVVQLWGFGLRDFHYTIVLDDERSISHALGFSKSLTPGRSFNLKRMRFAVASSEAILEFRNQFLYRYSKSDDGFSRSAPSVRKKHNPIFWPDDSMAPRRRNGFQQLKSRHQVNTRITYYHDLPRRPGWVGVFHLYSPEDSDTVVPGLEARLEEFCGLLGEYAETFNVLAFRYINPLTNFGVLSPTCIRILEMVAEGNSSEEIGRQLHMSERGVDYHLDKARHILMAKNRTNLVAKAFQQGVL